MEHDEILADSVEDAMEQFEDMIIEHIQEEISYNEEMLKNFRKG